MKKLKDLSEIFESRQIIGIYCVYFLFSGDELVYIGKSNKNGFDRIRQHFDDSKKHFDSYAIVLCDESEVCELETAFILKHRPKYNKSISSNAKYYSINRLVSETKIWSKDKAMKIVSSNGIENHELHGKLYINVVQFKAAMGL